jgi:hypothetical protein
MASAETRLKKPALDPLLSKLGDARQALLMAERQLRRGCVQAKALGALQAEIDGLAGVLTGDRSYFHLKPHTANTAFRGSEG